MQDILLGRIINWQALGGPDQPLGLYVRRDRISGVGRVARKLLFADYAQAFKAAKYFDSSPALETAVETAPWSLAITGVSSAHKRNVKILALEGTTPNYDSIRSGDYPLF